MNKYFRITAYHPHHNVCAIIDCNGLYEQCWMFSSLLVKKDFLILAVSRPGNFQFGNIPPIEEDTEHVFVRACAKGKPKQNGNTFEINGKSYTVL